MFSLRRTPKDPATDWPALLSLLEDDDRRAAVRQISPGEARESYLAALRRIAPPLAQDTLASGRRLHTAAKLVDRPTIAVAGMLNSGKTSLVSAFLSPSGRRRTLRGMSNDEGTHRFVLWLPESWRGDDELWSLLIGRIGDSLGAAPEELADEPVDAARQYNNRGGTASELKIPLLATDPGLDALGVGLLDCPDIVSDAEFGLGSPQERRDLLGRAATLCSAFLIVTGPESARDTTLADLLRIASDLMPGVPRMLAINKVRPRQTPDAIHESFSPLVKKFSVSVLYAAYDFEVPASRPFIPPTDVAIDADDPLPVFFEVAADPDDNPPAAIDSSRLLAALPTRLDRATLFNQLHRALRLGLETLIWQRGVETIRADADTSLRKTRDCQQVLLDASLEFFAHRKLGGEVMELRLHQSERIVRQLSESFAATVPWYARWGVRMNTAVRRVMGNAGDFVRSLTPTALARRRADEIKQRFRSGEYGGLIDPDALINEIGRHGGTLVLSHFGQSTVMTPESSRTLPRPVDAGDSPLLPAIQRAVRRFEIDDFTTLDPRRLDEAIAEMWKEIPLHKRVAAGLTPLAAMFAVFGAALMIPIDFGTNFILAASIPELFAAAGLTGLSAMWAGNRSWQDIGQQAARQQLADFVAVLCDELGVARSESVLAVRVGQHSIRLPAARIPVAEAQGPRLPLYQMRDEFVTELKQLLPLDSRSGDNKR